MKVINDVSARFIEAYDYLLSNGYVADKKDFASKIGVSSSMITEIFKGRSNVGVTAIQNIVLLFNISAEWLLTGQEDMTKTNHTLSTEHIKTDYNSNNKDNKRSEDKQDCSSEIFDKFLSSIKEYQVIISEQAEEIGALKQTIKQLRKELGDTASAVDGSTIASVG